MQKKEELDKNENKLLKIKLEMWWYNHKKGSLFGKAHKILGKIVVWQEIVVVHINHAFGYHVEITVIK